MLKTEKRPEIDSERVCVPSRIHYAPLTPMTPTDQYFSVPLKIARRKLSGMRDSLVAGSTWKPTFRKALDTYPNLETQHLEFTVLGCDACNLGGRKSTIQGRLSGEPYDPVTYEVSRPISV